MRGKIILFLLLVSECNILFSQNPVEKTYSLENIEVQGRRTDRLTGSEVKRLQVEKNLSAVTGTAAEVFRQLPAIITDIEGGILYRGSENPGMFLNGVPYGLLEENSGDMFIQLPAYFFNRISASSFPPIEWMPEGDAGMINMASSFPADDYSPVMISLGGGLQERYNAGTIVNLNPGKFQITGKYNYRHEYRKRSFSKTTTNASGTTVMNNNADARPNIHLADLSINYELSSRDLLSAYGLFYKMDYDRYGKIRNNKLVDGALKPIMFRHRYNDQHQKAYAGEARWEHRFRNPGEMLEVVFNYNNFGYNEGNEYQNEKPETSSIVAEENYYANQTKNNYYVSIMYNRPFIRGWLLKAGHVSLFKSQHYLAEGNKLVNGNWNEDFQKQDVYTFDRRIQFHYFQLTKKWHNFMAELGVQGELNRQKIKSQYYLTGSQEFIPLNKKTSRIHIYPRLSLTYKGNRGDELSFKYVQRAVRPTGNEMNPYIDRSDITYIKQGNPYLKDEKIHAFELSYQYAYGPLRIVPAVYYRNKKNRIMDIATTVSGTSETIWRKNNVGHSQSYGLEIVANYVPFKFLSVNFSGNMYSDEIDGRTIGYDKKKKMLCADLKGNVNFQIAPDTEFQLDAFYVSDQLTPQGKIKHRSSINAGLSQYFMKRKLKANASINNIFDGLKETTIVNTEGLQLTQVRNRDARVAWLNISYFL